MLQAIRRVFRTIRRRGRTLLPASFDDVFKVVIHQRGDWLVITLHVRHACTDGSFYKARRRFLHPENKLPERVREWIDLVALAHHNKNLEGC
jgi:hypothetical protein